MNKVIHGGTVVQTTLHVVDEDGNVVQSIAVRPTDGKQDDPLLIKRLDQASFEKAFLAVTQLRGQVQEQLDGQQVDVVEEIEPTD